MSLRDDILKRINADLPSKEIEFKGTRVKIRALNAGETLDIYGRGQERVNFMSAAAARIVIGVVTDPVTGARVFSPDDADVLLSGQPADALEFMELLKEVRDLSGTDKELLEDAKKNSTETPPSSST